MKWYWILLLIIALVVGAVPNAVALGKKIKDKATASKAGAGS